MPAHQYARLSSAYLQPKTAKVNGTMADAPDVGILALAQTTRAYTRVVLRLRAQAESEHRYLKTLQSVESSPAQASRLGTRQPSVSSRAPSPTSSHSHSRNHSRGKNEHGSASLSSLTTSRFRSPLYRPGRAPVLRVFVPSPEGDWLSDASVVECEAELKRSGVLKFLQVGDIVWDVAVGDEGNLGRLIWDGSYLVVRVLGSIMTGAPTHDTVGLGLQVLPRGRTISLFPQPGVFSILLSSRYSNRWFCNAQPPLQSHRLHRCASMGIRDRNQSTAAARPVANGNVSLLFIPF